MTHNDLYFNVNNLKVAELAQICEVKTGASDYPFANKIVKNIAIYNGDQVRDAATESVFRADGVARCFGCNHDDIEISARFDFLVQDGEAVCEGQRRAVLNVGLDFILVKLFLKLVGRQNHDEIR